MFRHIFELQDNFIIQGHEVIDKYVDWKSEDPSNIWQIDQLQSKRGKRRSVPPLASQPVAV